MSDSTTQNVLRPNELTGVVGRETMDALAPLAGVEAWQEYRRSYDAASRLEVVTAYPLQLDFELNASCNLKCPMCPISAESPKGKGKATWFSIAEFQACIQDAVAQGLRALKLNYINEPLIRKDLPEFVSAAKAAGVLDIYLSTNAMLLDKAMARRLIEAGLSRIQISIDATTAATYERVRPGGNLAKVVANTLRLLELRKEMGSVTPLVRVSFVKTEINEGELDDFVEYWRDKVDMVGIQEFIKPPATTNATLHSNKSVDRRKFGFHCSFPFKQVVVNNERKILPCCTFWGEQLPLGEFTGPESIIQAWNSDAMRYLRDIHRAGEYWRIGVCRNCVEAGDAAENGAGVP